MNTKAKRRLSEFDFSKEGCHVSLVGPKMGGPANGVTVLKLASLYQQNEENMQEEMITKAAHEEFVAKAISEALEPVQKALADAQAEVEKFKTEKAAFIEKARKEQLANIMGADNPKLDEEFNVIKNLDQAVFDIVIKSKKEAAEAIDKSEMFNEIGVSGEAEIEKSSESREMKILKQKYSAK